VPLARPAVAALTVFAFLRAGISVVGANLRDEQVQGTLEALLASGLPVRSLALGMAAYPMVSAAMSAVVYFVVGALAGARSVPDANWLLALTALMIGSVALAGVGLIGAALVLVFQRAAAATGWLVAVMALAGGEMFPPDLLPGWLGALSGLSPFTQILVVARAALLEGAGWSGSFPRLALLVLQALAFTALGLWALTLGLRYALRTGGLAQY
jgi:ABC-2 type transport system permease protein